MSLTTQISIKIKTEEITFIERFLCYAPITLSHDDADLQKMVTQTLDKCKCDQSNMDVYVTIKAMW